MSYYIPNNYRQRRENYHSQHQRERLSKTTKHSHDYVGGFIGYSSHWGCPTVHLEAICVIS